MTASQNFPFVLSLIIVVALCLMQASCPDDSSLDDCSRRNKPQYHVGEGEWSCKDRERR